MNSVIIKFLRLHLVWSDWLCKAQVKAILQDTILILMGVALLVFCSLLFLTKLARVWSPSFLHFPDALCNDGSLPLYYSSLSSTSKDWLIFLPGGAGCSNPESCINRLQVDPGLTSSKVYGS